MNDSYAPGTPARASFFAMFDASTPYRNCEADDIRHVAASVKNVRTSSSRDSFNGRRKFHALIEFADGTVADMTSVDEKVRDEFAAEFALRVAA